MSSAPADFSSSVAVTSSEMNMIAGLLVAGRRKYPDRDLASFAEPARLLVRSFQSGVTNERNLEDILERSLRTTTLPHRALERWESEGGAHPKMAA